jgi:hypothetical protein
VRAAIAIAPLALPASSCGGKAEFTNHPNRGAMSVHFSRFGEPVHVQVPAAATTTRKGT